MPFSFLLCSLFWLSGGAQEQLLETAVEHRKPADGVELFPILDYEEGQCKGLEMEGYTEFAGCGESCLGYFSLHL